MYFFSKVATSSRVVLGLTGLAVFLSPLGWGDSSKLLSSIYKEVASKLDSLNLDLLKSTEEEQVSKLLEPLFEQFESVFEFSKKEGEKELENLNSQFDKVKQVEQELQTIYEQNTKNFKSLENVSKYINDLLIKQLSEDSERSSSSSEIGLLTQVNNNLDTWSESISSLIAILNPAQTSSPSPPEGGALKEAKPSKH